MGLGHKTLPMARATKAVAALMIAREDRALALAEVGDLRTAAELVEMAVHANPTDRAAHEARVEV